MTLLPVYYMFCLRRMSEEYEVVGLADVEDMLWLVDNVVEADEEGKVPAAPARRCATAWYETPSAHLTLTNPSGVNADDDPFSAMMALKLALLKADAPADGAEEVRTRFQRAGACAHAAAVTQLRPSVRCCAAT